MELEPLKKELKAMFQIELKLVLVLNRSPKTKEILTP